MTSVDEAYQRYLYLTDALGRLIRASMVSPISEENLHLGLIQPGDTPVQAKAKISRSLDGTRARLTELALIDMCAAFEGDCQKRLPTAVGEARRVLTKHYDIRIMSQIKNQLLRKAEDFGSLDAIFKAVEEHIPKDSAARLRQLRDERNRVVHGASTSPNPRLPLDDARVLLNAVLDFIF